MRAVASQERLSLCGPTCKTGPTQPRWASEGQADGGARDAEPGARSRRCHSRGCGEEARLLPVSRPLLFQPRSPKSRALFDSLEIWVIDLGREELVRLALPGHPSGLPRPHGERHPQSRAGAGSQGPDAEQAPRLPYFLPSSSIFSLTRVHSSICLFFNLLIYLKYIHFHSVPNRKPPHHLLATSGAPHGDPEVTSRYPLPLQKTRVH